MKYVLAGGLMVVLLAALHIPKLKNKRGIVLAAYAAGMILLSFIYNYRTIGNIVRFSHPVNQNMYQPEFFENGEYTDAFLDKFLKGKTVYTPDDADEVRDDIDVDDDWDYLVELVGDRDDYWLYYYYHGVNMWQYLKFNHATVVKDESLNGIQLSGDQKAHYEDLGSANDMMRYTFPLTPYHGEWGNGFYYFWFYNYFIGDSRVYVCTEGLTDTNELVVLWQHEDSHDTDSYYIASKDYFYGEILR